MMLTQRWLVTLVCLVATLTGLAQSQRPNFVVIFVDDMGYADLGCFGNPVVKTPFMDQLAAEGLRLTNFYVNSPICSASRVALTTGQYQGRWRIHSFLNTRAGNANRGMADYLSTSAPTTAKKLKAKGYATAHFGKWHMGGGRDVEDAPLPQAYGFDESLVSFEGLGDRIISNPRGLERARALGHGRVIPCERWERMEIQTSRAIDFIQRHREQPFYLRLFPNDVHDRHDPKPGTADKYASVSSDPFVRNFLAVLEEMDRQIGRLIDEIDRLGLGEETLILLTSDNGPTDWPRKYATGPPAGYTGPFHGRKWSLYEGGIRMPFIARWRGVIPAGRVDRTSVMTAIDVSPTLCRLAGVQWENQLDGVDRSDVLQGNPSARSRPVFWQYGHPHAILQGGLPEHQSPTFAMRMDRWKLLVNPDGSEAQLYDLHLDPGEQRNRIVNHPERAAMMRRQLIDWAQEVGFRFDATAIMREPEPAMAIWASNQLLRFVNHGVVGDRDHLEFYGRNWLALPDFRAPKVAGGRDLMIRGEILPVRDDGVVLSHGGANNGYALFLRSGKLVFRAKAQGQSVEVVSESSIRGRVSFNARWKRDGGLLLEVDGQRVSSPGMGHVIQHEPRESIEIGSDHGATVGDYEGPNYLSAKLFNLQFRYPNGT